ncbi:MAG: FAD-dependent oxidoreductase [Gaiellaceae bacterium]|jgi:2,4-dienoyl-CoA reductase-like NADH-dependent reductase (Old Yellow Enzyme family)/thioredoxin reductase
MALDHLFSPLELGPVELPNRIVSTAHQTTLVHDHLPTDDFVAYHEARARGGAGLIVLEATAVHPSGLLTSHTLGGYLPEIVGAYRRVAAAVRVHGTRLFVQLLHGGREQIATPPRPPALAPSPVPSPRFRAEPRAATAAEIDELVTGYARCAELAAEGGLDGVEVSAAHRYLIEQFLDPELNLREDEWREGSRFLVEVLRAVRAAAPGLALGVRISADSPRARTIAELAVREGADYVSLVLGDSATYLGSVGIVPPPPVEEAAIAQFLFEAGLPRIATSRMVDVELADRLVGEGRVEALGMTRALIADPDLPRKAREGRLAERIGCIGCNACIAHYHAGTPLRCAVNPRTGREARSGPPRASEARRLVVVGGGPAGIAAAVEAGRAGHEVVLLERDERLGGQIVLAGAAPGGRELADRFLDNAERGLGAAGVEVRLGTGGPGDLEADAYVLATGARPYRGEDGPTAWDVLSGAVPEGDRVLVADWGGDPGGLDAAELLAAAGKEVTLTVSSVSVGELVHQYRRNLYLQRLYRAGVRILHHHELVDVDPGQVRLRNVFAPELEMTVAADAVVRAFGRVPVEVEAPPGVRVERAGDCLSPRSLEEAVLEGTLAARRAVA